MTPEQIRRRFSRALAKHGLAGTIRLGFRQAFYSLSHPREVYLRRRRRWREWRFDRKFGVDTRGRIILNALQIQSPNLAHGHAYGAILPEKLLPVLQRLPIDYRQFTFIDFGSGKGKALMLASDFPFRRIIGVEFSRELHQVAQHNLQRYRQKTGKRMEIESLCMDAAAFELPAGPLVCYFYNPFGPEVLAKVLQNIRQALEASPRPVYVIYQLPLYQRVMEQSGFLSELASGQEYVIYRALPLAPPENTGALACGLEQGDEAVGC